jgi:hypothetical protein
MLLFFRVDKKVAMERVDRRLTGNVVAYDARLNKCVSTECWGLNFSVSDSMKLPDYNKHVFRPLYKHTILTVNERVTLREEGIQYSEKEGTISDPGQRLKGKVLVTQDTRRHVGLAPTEGRPALDNEKKGVLREEQRKEREKKERLMDRGDERVKG